MLNYNENSNVSTCQNSMSAQLPVDFSLILLSKVYLLVWAKRRQDKTKSWTSWKPSSCLIELDVIFFRNREFKSMTQAPPRSIFVPHNYRHAQASHSLKHKAWDWKLIHVSCKGGMAQIGVSMMLFKMDLRKTTLQIFFSGKRQRKHYRLGQVILIA